MLADQAPEIPLWRKGEIIASALVDADDYDALTEYVWHINTGGYAIRYESVLSNLTKTGRRTVAIPMHRQILGIIDRPDLWGDHKDGKRLDNRKSELRAVTPRQNRHNSRSASATGVKGVSRHKQTGKFEARINLGLFDTVEEAAEAVRKFNDWAGRPQVRR